MSEWCTIESDPGVFTELIHNIGVKGVQVEEILDMDMISSKTEPVYGLIFLFKYISNSGYNPNILSTYDEDLYFPKQVIVNACATQAIISILLNNDDKIPIGDDLTELKSFTKLMDPYMKGLSISNSEKIRLEHNKFAKPEPFVFSGKKKATDDDEVFHFVAYIHFKDNIYEIDGTREGPVLIKESVSQKDWVDEVKPSIFERISLYANNEIKFNLMSVVQDRRLRAKEVVEELEAKRNYISNIISGNKNMQVDSTAQNLEHLDSLPKNELEAMLVELDFQISDNRMVIEEENHKFDKYKIENERRQHNYIPLIYELLKIMSEKNSLEGIYKEAKDEESKKSTEKSEKSEKK
jgi:ubiquitin carboxyl-terminal hydrolase L5